MTFVLQKKPFLGKNDKKLPKMPPLTHLRGHISAQIKNHAKSQHNFVPNTLRNIFTKNKVIWSIWGGVEAFSVEDRVPKKRREKRVKLPFLGGKMTNFWNFSKIFWNLRKTIRIHQWSKIWVIWTIFGAFMVILVSFFGCFPLYISIGKIDSLGHT